MSNPWRDEATLREGYVEQDKSTPTLAEEWDTTASTVLRWLKKYDIPVENTRSSTANHEYTSIRVTKDAAEQARALKRDSETWSDFVTRQGGNTDTDTTASEEPTVDAETIRTVLQEELPKEETVDVDLSELRTQIGSIAENAAYRGAQEAIKQLRQ